MSTTEYDATKAGAATVVAERHETTGETRNLKPETGNCTALCHHVMESGFCCQSPALRDRRYCYSHLRLRGERLRMARAIAQRQPYRFMLPALDDLFAVQAAVEHVARALGAGLLERRQAGTLLYALQQSAINHRILALVQMNASSRDTTISGPTLSPKAGEKDGAPAGDIHPEESKPGTPWGPRSGGAPAGRRAVALGGPPLSPSVGHRAAESDCVEEYPQFEAEYGLPAGLDLSQPAHVLFPAPEQVWQVVPAPPMVARPHRMRWTKESIELEELNQRREKMGVQAFNQQAQQIQNRISNQAYAEFRQRQDAVWQAEADRRNAAEKAKDQEYAAMDEGHRRAYHLGIVRGLEAAHEQAEQEAQRKPAVKAAVGS